MGKRVEDVPFVERTTDIINLATGTLATEKYNKWLAKSDKKVNPKSFAGKFLKVSFWISTFYAAICLFFLVVNSISNDTTGARLEPAQTQDMLMCLLLIPLPFVLAIKVLRSRYYGLYKLLWLFPIILWTFTLGLPICGILNDLGVINIFN